MPMRTAGVNRRPSVARSLRTTLFAPLVALSLVLPAPAFAQDDPEDVTVVEMKTVAGVRFDPPRFLVAPGAKVKLAIENTDDMAHNWVLTLPGARLDVVNAAMAMPFTPTSDFIPKTDKVLQHSPMLLPGKSATVVFTAPAKEGAYPFVCTYPGHGYLMYGAMYVGRTDRVMPPLAKDELIPEEVRALGEAAKLHAYAPQPPYYYRTFMRDSGPASIAVCLPGGQNYCWDAGACRLRYVWRGPFVDPMPHWTGNGDGLAEVKGRIYYRSSDAFPLRFGVADKQPKGVKFLGYSLVQRYPEFRYTVDGVEVRERIKQPHHGSGIDVTFTIENATTPVFYVTDPAGGATLMASAGAVKDGVLTLTAAEAKQFTVTLTEVPGREPLRYFSMNDTPSGRGWKMTENGVRGRAVNFDGVKQQVDTGVKTDALANGGTIALWVKRSKQAAPKAAKPKVGAATQPAVTPPAASREQVFVGATAGKDALLVGWNLGGSGGFGLHANVGNAEANTSASGSGGEFDWHHVAVTFAPGAGYTFYLDGRPSGTASGELPKAASIYLGSAGGSKFATATMDEAIIDDRPYSAAEIAALAKRERPRGDGTSAR